jgi:molecular chaperone IbpA
MKEVYVNSLDIPGIHRFAVGFDRMFSELSRTAGTLNSSNYPPYNIIKHNETTYTIEVAVAGFDETELDVELKDGELHVKGVKGDDLSQLMKGIDYLHNGIAARNFIRTFALAENVEVRGATVKNGILSVTLEHIIPESAKPKKIAITFQK